MNAVPLGQWMGLRAALLLARGRAEGAAQMVGETPAGQAARARHSFLATLLCLPLFIAIQDLAIQNAGAIAMNTLPRASASFVLGWFGYAVLSHQLAEGMGRAALWPRFIVLWNWCNLVQYLLMACATVPMLLGAPPLVAQTAWLVAMGWGMWLQWSATRLGLGLPRGHAALMVLVDIALGMVLLRLTGG
jgi:hypothetical protein